MITGAIFDAGHHDQYYYSNTQVGKQESEWLALRDSRPPREYTAGGLSLPPTNISF